MWGDRIFVTAAVPLGEPLSPAEDHRHGAHDNLAAVHRQRFSVLAVRRSDGHILWQRTVHEQVPHEGGHYTSSFASNSPVTDGERVYAFFGSAGLFCLDVEGNPVWDVDLGDMHSKHGHGEGASPALHGNTLVVNWDHEGDSFVVAFDKSTGKERWKVSRDEVTAWSTPIVVEHEGTAQVIISASNRIRGYDLMTGEVIWECGGLSHNVVASPVAGGGLVYAGSNYDTRALLAIRLDGARGDITGTDRVAWTRKRDTPYVPSPLLYGERLYFLKVFHGLLTCVNAGTGETIFGPVRLPDVSEIYASPVGAAGRVYVTSIGGTTLVLNHEGPPETMAVNQLDDRFNASPALADGELYLRGERHLYCIAEDAPQISEASD